MERVNRRIYRDERKKDITVSLTVTAATKLSELGESLGVSRSQLIELFARGEIQSDTYAVLMGELQAS